MFSTLAAIALMSLLPTRGQLVLADQLILSDSFERGSQAPEGWRSGANINGVKYVYAKTGSDGERSLSLQKSANRYFPIAQWFRTLPHKGSGSSLAVVAKVKAAEATKAILDIQFLDGGGQMLGHEWLAYIGAQNASDSPATHDWKDYGGRTEIPSNTHEIVVALQIYGPGSVWFDELDVFYTEKKEGPVRRPSDSNEVASSLPSREASKPIPVPRPKSLQLKDGSWTRYLLIAPGESKRKPPRGFPLLIALPGGDGSAEFFPFVKRLQEQALEGNFFVAQPIAPPHIVWPTQHSLALYAPTETAIAAIVEDVAHQHGIDRDQIFALAWSSSGPAVYNAVLQPETPLKGAFIAMSVFKPGDLPPLAAAADKSIFLYHSREDQTCPFGMAEAALTQFREAGARVTLLEYAGGHGWTGPVYEDVQAGVKWLQEAR